MEEAFGNLQGFFRDIFVSDVVFIFGGSTRSNNLRFVNVEN
jgi:hypothetical protein